MAMMRWCVGIALATAALWLGFDFFCGSKFGPIERSIERDLPIGSSREQVERWFASRAITYHETNPPDGLVAQIKDANCLDNAEIRLAFYFTDEGTLRRKVVYRFVYSL